MTLAGLRRARVSRETRLLLATVAISVAALGVLARLRYPRTAEAPAATLQPILNQLVPRMALETISAEIAGLRPKLNPFVVPLFAADLQPATDGRPASDTQIALRVGSDVAVTLLTRTVDPLPPAVVVNDAAARLAIVRAPAQPVVPLTSWMPDASGYSRYLVAVDASGPDVALRPIFVGATHSVFSPIYSSPIWTGPSLAALAPGTFLFTPAGEFAGLVVPPEGAGPAGAAGAIVPPDAVMTLVNSLLASGTSEPQRLGVDVQALDRALAGAAGVDAGVMVTWVDPNGPAAGQLAPFDVIEMIGGERMWTPAHWRARVMRVTPGETLQLQVRRRGEVRRIDIVAQPVSGGADTGLGVTLQADRQGTLLVVRVDRRSAAARAGLRPGDVITSLDGVTRLTPAAVDRAFDALPVDRPLLLAVERGDEHRVVAVTRR